MKKFLRFLGILLLLIIVIILVLGLIEPKDQTIERSMTMNAPKAVVWEQIAKYKEWPHWSPWVRMDSTMKMEYSGEEGTVGSSYHWTGQGKNTGEGIMTNAGMNDNTIKYDLKFIKPFDGKADGWFKVVDSNNQTKVTWAVHMHHSYPMNAMLAFMNMDKMMGDIFESGLKNMKEYTEAHATTASSAMIITETEFPGHIYCGVRKVVGWNDMHQFFMDSYSMVGKELSSNISGPASGIYWTWDTVKHESDMAAVFPVKDSSKAVKGASFFNVPASSACMVVYNGPYQGMMAPHMMLKKYCAEKGMKVKLMIEEYVKSPNEEKDSTKYVTNIYYLCDGMGDMKK